MEQFTYVRKNHKKLLRETITRDNGWYAVDDFNFLLRREQERTKRQEIKTSCIVIDLSRHKKISGLIKGGVYRRFLAQFLAVVNATCRQTDLKCLSPDYRISIVLTNTGVHGARKYLDKLAAAQLDYFQKRQKPAYLRFLEYISIACFHIQTVGKDGQSDASPMMFKRMLSPSNREDVYKGQPIRKLSPTQFLSTTRLQRFGTNNFGGKSADGDSDFMTISAPEPGHHMADTQAGEKYEQHATSKSERIPSDNYFNWEIFSLNQEPVPFSLPQLKDLDRSHAPHFGYFPLKRLLDIAGATVGLLLFAPVMLLIAIAIKATSKGPVIFRQQRIGYRGKPMTFLKFRSMKQSNDNSIHKDYVQKLIQGDNEEINNGSDSKPLYKITDDPRITRIGAFIRKTSLDELPQFFNVLGGSMSLVGPRPPIPYEVDVYQRWHLDRVMQSKPGITGLWQVYGRNQTTFDEMVRLDLRYIKIRSIWLDIKILLKTIKVLFNPKSGM